MTETARAVDLLVVGGGINGAGIARDAAGRGLSVMLVERGDLGGATSSASSKLIHGGLRYLEHGEFRLVAESLREREVLLRAAPHLVRPMRFVMPHVPELRPAWMIRAGLLLYDLLALRRTLPASQAVDLTQAPWNDGLRPALRRGFAYSDCHVDDARLVIATARDAAARGATIRTRTACVKLRRDGAQWRALLQPRNGDSCEIGARAVVNAAGPWAAIFLAEAVQAAAPVNLRLVQGSHIVLPSLYRGEHAFILQNDDRRVIFAYPWASGHTLVGTTDVELHGRPEEAATGEAEIEYLCRAVRRYFQREVGPRDVVHHYAGVRALLDDGRANPSQATRDYELRMSGEAAGAPLLSVLGGKITTYRRLAEWVMAKLKPWFPRLGADWTADAPLDGGDAGPGGWAALSEAAAREWPWLPLPLRQALLGRHGSNLGRLLGDARALSDLGTCYGDTLYEREVDWFIDHEWAVTAEDVLWRRTQCGLQLTSAQRQAIADHMARRAV